MSLKRTKNLPLIKSVIFTTKIKRLQEKEAYITKKDHKNDFPNKISCRLTKPAQIEYW